MSKILGEALVAALAVRSPWLVAALWLTCVSCSNEKAITVPAELDSGFSLQHVDAGLVDDLFADLAPGPC